MAVFRVTYRDGHMEDFRAEAFRRSGQDRWLQFYDASPDGSRDVRAQIHAEDVERVEEVTDSKPDDD
jgi:hypothetical protein